LHEDYLVLTVAGAFWSVTLAQGAIAAINTMIKDKPQMPKGMGHPHAMQAQKHHKAKTNAA
jgi:oxygen-independent coproporphyrinogen-3 oxidase